MENDQALENNIPSLGTLSMPDVHGLKCHIESHTFAFVYSRCEIKQMTAQELSNKTVEIDYLLGVSNLNTANPIHRKTIDVICGEFKTMLLTELTTNITVNLITSLEKLKTVSKYLQQHSRILQLIIRQLPLEYQDRGQIMSLQNQ